MRSEQEIRTLLDEMKDTGSHYDRLVANGLPLKLYEWELELFGRVDMRIELLEWIMQEKEINWDWKEHRDLKRWLSHEEEWAEERK